MLQTPLTVPQFHPASALQDLQEQLLSQLSEALSSLTEEEWQMIQALYWEGVSAREYARRLGVYHRTVLYWRDKILEKLRQKF